MKGARKKFIFIQKVVSHNDLMHKGIAEDRKFNFFENIIINQNLFKFKGAKPLTCTL